MKPLSKKQRETLDLLTETEGIYIDKTDNVYSVSDGANFTKIHYSTGFSLEYWGLVKTTGRGRYFITNKGKQALAKPTRSRGKKKKPDLGDVHKNILV